MAKGDTASRIATGVQPGLVPLQNGPKPVSNPSLAPTFGNGMENMPTPYEAPQNSIVQKPKTQEEAIAESIRLGGDPGAIAEFMKKYAGFGNRTIQPVGPGISAPIQYSQPTTPFARPTNVNRHRIGTRPSLMKQYNNVR